MASPQTEDGYTRIANELLEAIVSFDFSKREYKVLMAVIRKTYGFNKKTDMVSQWSIAQMTGISRANVCRCVSDLMAKNVIVAGAKSRFSHGQQIPEIGVNKNHQQWGLTVAKTATEEPLPKQQQSTVAKMATVAKTAPLPKQQQNRCQNGNTTVAKTATTKDNTKDKNKRQGARDKLALADLLSEGVEKQHAEDWLEVRRVKKAPLTETAWRGMKREAGLAGISVADAVRICAERNWQAFNHNWNWRSDEPAKGWADDPMRGAL